MQRTKLVLASLAVATGACLAVMYALREPAGLAPAPPPAEVEAAPSELARAAAPSPQVQGAEAPASPTSPDEATFMAEVAHAAAAREQALRDALLRIGEDDALPLDARLDRYREAVESAREQAPKDVFFRNPSMLAEVFLRMDGVQRELAALGPAARSRELAHIRRDLGFSDEEIARMERIDERRETRWQNGLAYMEARARVAATFEGAALDAELRALRDEYFAQEAPTIEKEERDGFYRFERPRIYGRN